MKDWAELADEYRDLELRHKEYREVGCLSNDLTNQKCTQKFVNPILRPWKNAWPCKRSVQAE